MRRNPAPVEAYDEHRDYTNTQLGELADELLRVDARGELCRDCGERGVATGHIAHTVQEPTDTDGNALPLDFPEFKCGRGHHWYQGEGAVRGIGGDNPILFEEHFQSRRRREIYNSLGSPDPSIVSGMYNRAHPQGRKINSPEARARHGASYYR
jgi:hypothetical protein